MTRLPRGGLVALVALACSQVPLGAQVAGFPVAPRATLDGWSVHGTVAFPGDAFGSGVDAAGTIGVRLGNVGVEATLAGLWPSGDNGDGAGAGVLFSFTPLRSQQSPFRLGIFAGLGAWRSFHSASDASWDEGGGSIVGGISYGFVVPTPVVSLVPWVAPRVSYISSDGAPPFEGTHAAFAAGIDAQLRNGIGFRAAYDRIFIPGDDASAFALALHFSFTPGF